MTETRTATVRVPASTSNLGSGFDCVGLAVNRWLTASVTVTLGEKAKGKIRINRTGALQGIKVNPRKDLLSVGFAAARAAARSNVLADVRFVVDSEIPVGRGLGSSAAAIVAGAALASNVFDLAQGTRAVFEIGTAIEGHPDNVAAAVLGGGVLIVRTPTGGHTTGALTISPNYVFVFAIPSLTLETKRARKVLPKKVTHADATRAAGRAAGLIHALAAGDDAMLEAGLLDDVLHIPYRRSLVPGFDDVVQAARNEGAIGATLSGSGPTILAVASRTNSERVGWAMRDAWRAHNVESEVMTSDGVTPGYSLGSRTATSGNP